MKLSKIALACALAAGMAAPQVASADDSFQFHGYARWGTSYEADGNTTISADGQTGNAAGRLGNEGNGGEWAFIKKFEPENGTKWDVGMMVEEWGSLALKQAWAGASNVFESQPDAYIWAGKVFHSRMQQGLNDYYLSIQDGQGAGIKGLDLGFANLELGFVDGGSGHDFAATSKLSGIQLSDDISMDIIANYGFTDNSDESTDIDAYLVVAKLSGWGQNFYYRHADDVENSLSWGRQEGYSSDYFSVDGSFALAERTNLEYLVSYHDIQQDVQTFTSANVEFNDITTGDRATYNVIVRPTYAWNDIHSTWLDVGYSVVDFDDDRENNDAWKVTLSQNIAVGGVAWARPMLRFYATVGEETNYGYTTDEDGAINGYSDQSTSDPLIVGAMFEAWW